MRRRAFQRRLRRRARTGADRVRRRVRDVQRIDRRSGVPFVRARASAARSERLSLARDCGRTRRRRYRGGCGHVVEPIVILVGTMSGNAEMVADELVSKLKKTGFAAQSIDMSKCGPGTFRPENLYIICTSTYGDGDVPDNATEFYGYLTTQRPDLTGIRYGVV